MGPRVHEDGVAAVAAPTAVVQVNPGQLVVVHHVMATVLGCSSNAEVPAEVWRLELLEGQRPMVDPHVLEARGYRTIMFPSHDGAPVRHWPPQHHSGSASVARCARQFPPPPGLPTPPPLPPESP